MLQVKDRAPLSSKFVFTDTTTAVSYCPKKRQNVILMSTLHKDAAVSSGSDKKPIIILDYNKNKGGVDNLDKLSATYTCQRMTRRWPMVVFYNILDVSAYNAFVLWTHIHQGWNSNKKSKRRMFLEEIGRSLVKVHIEQRERVPRDPAAAALVRQLQSSPSTPSTPTATRRASAPAPPQHQLRQLQPQWDHLILKERGVRSALAIRTERQTHCASPAKNISAKNTQKLSLFATHASNNTQIHVHVLAHRLFMKLVLDFCWFDLLDWLLFVWPWKSTFYYCNFIMYYLILVIYYLLLVPFILYC